MGNVFLYSNLVSLLRKKLKNMATKTFEELKQMAIQIRDEKANKHNTATRIGTQMLEHLNKLEQEYYNKENIDEQKEQTDVKFSELEKESLPLSSNILVYGGITLEYELIPTIYYFLKGIDNHYIGQNYKISVEVPGSETVFFYKSKNNIIESSYFSALRNNQSVKVTIDNEFDSIHIRSSEYDKFNAKITVSIDNSVKDYVSNLNTPYFKDVTNPRINKRLKELYIPDIDSSKVYTIPYIRVHQGTLLIQILEDGLQYVRYTATNIDGWKGLIELKLSNVIKGYAIIDIDEDDTDIDVLTIDTTVCSNVNFSPSIKAYLLNKEIEQLSPKVETLEKKVSLIDVAKYPFANNATFIKGITVYPIYDWLKSLDLYNCKVGYTYYIKQFWKNPDTPVRVIKIYEKSPNGEEIEFAKYQVNAATEGLSTELIETNNMRALVDWSEVSGIADFTENVAPIHILCLNYLPNNNVFLSVPSTLYATTDIELNLYNQMVLCGCKENIINDVLCDGFEVHPRFVRFKPTDSSPANTQVYLRYNLDSKYTKAYLSKLINIKSVRKSAGAGKTIKVLCIGGSTTEQGYYVEHIRDLAKRDGIDIHLIGTMKGTINQEDIGLEGRSGWRAKTYFTLDGTADGKPTQNNPFFDNTYTNFDVRAFNFSKYMEEHPEFEGCDVINFAFGGNDNASSQENVDDAKTYYDAMIASFKAYNPNIKIMVWMYHGGYSTWEGNMQQIESTQGLYKYILDWYDNREGENIYVVPCGLNVDPLYDYNYTMVNTSAENEGFKEIKISDPIHPPKETGCKKLANACYPLIKYFASLL